MQNLKAVIASCSMMQILNLQDIFCSHKVYQGAARGLGHGGEHLHQTGGQAGHHQQEAGEGLHSQEVSY